MGSHAHHPRSAFARGPHEGLDEVEKLLGNENLLNYYLLSSARGHFLAELGRNVEASAEFEKAAGLTANESERRFLQQRAQELTD